MRKIIIIFLLALLPNSFDSRPRLTSQKLIKIFTKYFLDQKLEKFIRYHPKGKPIRIIIKYSTLGSEDFFRAKDFREVAQLLKWSTGILTHGECVYKKGVGAYEVIIPGHGGLHIETIACSYYRGKPYIDVIVFVAGE